MPHRIDPTTHKHSLELRRNATKPEEVLWYALRSRQVANLKFRRQHPVGRYIVDFYCAEVGLVIEVDGRSHDGRGEIDAQRQLAIESLGIGVLRVSNDDVLGNLEGVIEWIAKVAADRDRLPSPSPSLKGRGIRKPR